MFPYAAKDLKHNARIEQKIFELRIALRILNRQLVQQSCRILAQQSIESQRSAPTQQQCGETPLGVAPLADLPYHVRAVEAWQKSHGVCQAARVESPR